MLVLKICIVSWASQELLRWSKIRHLFGCAPGRRTSNHSLEGGPFVLMQKNNFNNHVLNLLMNNTKLQWNRDRVVLDGVVVGGIQATVFEYGYGSTCSPIELSSWCHCWCHLLWMTKATVGHSLAWTRWMPPCTKHFTQAFTVNPVVACQRPTFNSY